ncbi:hypothetical protein CHH28_08040 [Bacterioplanes sanyensis]|uniref:ABC transporter substrate-binding protein n=1 Tax=Bacterioplanes sanyensis TaxID=1249553 RepID=A0A222FIQ3_9GAMM|nr:hypothetical protein [Bacterioplanes sanyensis]ASP38629.1 hypothetical protein CHH28_08040 [Bacterioplanes sanyensis]
MDAMQVQRWITIAVLTLVCWAPASWAADVMVFGHRPHPSIQAFAKQLQQQSQHTVSMTTQVSELSKADLVVAVGAQSLAAVAGAIDSPLVAVFVSREQYLAHAQQVKSAVFIEPSLLKQLRLARALVGPEKRLGVLLNNQQQWTDLTSMALPEDGELAGIGSVSIQQLDNFDSLNHALVALLKDSEALVGVYDTELYSAANIKNILITAYRQNVPLIGPSNAYIKAGALATLHSDLNHVAQRTVEVIDAGLSGQWPAADYNPYFDVRYNDQVARSLNMVLPEAADIIPTLQEAPQ